MNFNSKPTEWSSKLVKSNKKKFDEMASQAVSHSKVY